MKQKKVFRELTEDQLGLVIGGTKSFKSEGTCTCTDVVKICMDGTRCIVDDQASPIVDQLNGSALAPRHVEVD